MKSQPIRTVIYSTLILFTFSSIVVSQPRRRPFKAQQRPAAAATAIGVRFGNDFEQQQYLLGGQLWIPLCIFWKLAPSFEYYFVDKDQNYSRWQYNGDLLFKPYPRAPFYLGSGLAVNNTFPKDMDSELDFGGNIVVGLDFGRVRLPSMYPYIQARWTIMENYDYFSLIGGINFVLK